MLKIDEDMAQARNYYLSGASQQCLELYAQIQADNKLTPDQSAEILYTTGLIKQKQGYYAEAQELFTLLYREGVARSQRYDETKALHQLGLLQYKNEQYQEALRLFRRELSLWYSEMRHYYSGLSANFLAQGLCHFRLGDLQEAAMYFRHAYTFGATESDYAAEGRALQAQADLALKLGKRKEATKLYKKALSAFKQAEDKEGIAGSNASLALLEEQKRSGRCL